MTRDAAQKPRIGVVPMIDYPDDQYITAYLEALRGAGADPTVLPSTADEAEVSALVGEYDGFVFTGGADVDPKLYGEEPFEGVVPSSERDEREGLLLQKILEADKPLLGICRGIQLINVLLGGDLYQDIPTQCPSETVHNMKPPYDHTVHSVKVEKDSPLYRLLGVEELAVSSLHHQAVRKAAPCLSVMARSEDGLIEGLRMPEKKFVWLIQWHPEFTYKDDENSRKIFAAFVKAAEQVG